MFLSGAVPENSKQYYGFTRFAIELNELNDDLRQQLPPTDTRFRPDQRFVFVNACRPMKFTCFFPYSDYWNPGKLTKPKKKRLASSKLKDHVLQLVYVLNGSNKTVIHSLSYAMRIRRTAIGRSAKNTGRMLNFFNYGR